MSEIKTNFEFPRGTDNVKFLQRLVQDLSKNFKALKDSADSLLVNSTTYGLDGMLFTGSFSIGVPAGTNAATTVTLTHNFGSVPSGFIVVDSTSSNTVYLTQPIYTRDSWTTTQITIRISILSIDFASSRTQTGTYKILVLR